MISTFMKRFLYKISAAFRPPSLCSEDTSGIFPEKPFKTNHLELLQLLQFFICYISIDNQPY